MPEPAARGKPPRLFLWAMIAFALLFAIGVFLLAVGLRGVPPDMPFPLPL